MKSFLIFAGPFKRALVLSVFLHVIIFAAIGFSNYFIAPTKKAPLNYVSVNLVGFPGGGGGGGGSGLPAGTSGGEKSAQPAAGQKETMKQLTVPQKAAPEASTSLRHPVEKLAKSKEKTPPKKLAIPPPGPGSEKPAPAGSTTGGGGSGIGGGGGSGLRIGVGEGPGGGFGGGYGDSLGTASFPYAYYLQIIIDRVSSNWFTAINNLDLSGEYQSIVYFRIQKNGQISDLKIEQSSGLPALDLSARRAVELAAPFPPLPRDFENDYLVIHLIFERSK
ncbi:MAG TPA: TonB C-terminal domain-containing protein [Candidatus Aminicenantes bacterium]|nr:TonB C-terminal domain-containing protein [Candidatus Aminicenantes bacterium]